MSVIENDPPTSGIVETAPDLRPDPAGAATRGQPVVEARRRDGPVALLLREFAGGGAERALINLANGFVECGFEVDLLVLQDVGPFRKYVDPRVRVVPVQAVRKEPLAAFGAAKLAAYLLRRRPARLISTLEALTLIAFFALAALGRRRDLLIRVATTYDREPRPFLRRVLVRWVYRWHVGHFVANSNASAANLAANFTLDDGRLKVIYNAVDFDAIQKSCAAEMEHGLPFAMERGFLLFAGRLTPAKRVDVLLRAVARLNPVFGARLVILGDGPLRDELLELIAELGLQERVLMPGFTANPYAYMSRAAAFVLSSDYEGMPTVLIEALACGCPVVSTDCVAGPREVLEDGRLGELVPVGDPDALAAAIHRTMQNPLPVARLKERAQSFSVQAAARAYAELLFPGRSGANVTPLPVTGSRDA